LEGWWSGGVVDRWTDGWLTLVTACAGIRHALEKAIAAAPRWEEIP